MRLIFLLISLFPSYAFAQAVCTAVSRAKLDSTLMALWCMDSHTKPVSDLVVLIGEGLIHTPYVEHTLEMPGGESLVINLEGLDCTTFVETVVAMARTAQLGDYSLEAYARQLQFLRYRDGQIAGYPSRLHYFSDWIYDNQQRGILKDISHQIGGQEYKNQVGFMSANPQHYAQLQNRETVEAMLQIEAGIRSRSYYYLPKALVESLESNIQPGDLIAITISRDDLDISHVGIAVEQNGRIHLMHASTQSKKVEISNKPLSDYLQAHKSQTGIMVGRLADAR
ncbi:MAG: DUF1460 domain-containing protein [Cyclobacteriaceae bacterium]|nr:DUF1460 domain-containing protein [Cyclobacteriaceae bacterium]